MSGTIELRTTEPGWIAIPDDFDAAEREAWVERCTTQLEAAWGELWSPEVAYRVREMLRVAVDERPDAQFVFDVWPVFRTVRARVQVDVFNPQSLPDWRAEGYSVLAYEDAPIGPGITCVRMHDVEGDGGEQSTIVEWCTVFESEEVALVVLVAPTLPHLLGQILPGLHGMIQSLQVGLPDGTAFRAAPPRDVVIDDEAIWDSLDLGEELRGSPSGDEAPLDEAGER